MLLLLKCFKMYVLCIYYSRTFHNHIVSACVNIGLPVNIGRGVNIGCGRCLYIALNNAFNNVLLQALLIRSFIKE